MDAGVRRVMGLISEMNVRYVVPVYQRPYSWGEEQCLQLWDDILACGRSREQTHFTGSIVTMQDGTASPQGVASLAVIDGQQRITTIALLLVALARYADAHAKERLPFSRQEILMSGYLTNPFRSGDDHYKLTLSKGDRATFRAVIDHLEDPSRPAPEGPSRILDNLALFERRLDALANVTTVWEGLRRLEVVSVTMAQGRDNAQLIFESMNSTGKDLSAADLIRNFVLMKYPLDRQAQAYQTYWRPLEDVLAPLGDEGAFDDFIRCFFQMAYAPERLGNADLYQVFKRYVSANAYDVNDRMGFLCLRLKDFAGYYVDAVRGGLSGADDADPVARRTSFHLAGIARLGGAAARPLVLELFRSCRRRECTREQLANMLGVLESYLLRRAVCDCEGSAQEHFLRHLVAKLAAVRSAGEKYYESYVALFLVEEGTPLERLVSSGKILLPEEDTAADMYELVQSLLAKAGFERYEISNYAKNGQYSRHNSVYWQYRPYIAFGAAGCGMGDNYRRTAIGTVPEYIAAAKALTPATWRTSELYDIEELIHAQQLEEFMFMGLRRSVGANLAEARARFGVDVWQRYQTQLAPFLERDYVRYDAVTERLYLTAKGMGIGNQIFTIFIDA